MTEPFTRRPILSMEDFLLLIDDGLVETEKEIDREYLRKAIDCLLDELPARQAEVLRMRFGFYGEKMTMRQIGEVYGVSIARIQQLEATAIRKLRHPMKSRKLIAWLP